MATIQGGSSRAVPLASAGITITGLKKLDAKLMKLSEAVRVKAMRKAMREATKIVAYRAASLAPDHTGRLSDSIRRRVTFKYDEVMGSIYSLQRGSKAAPHAFLVHEGTGPRKATHTWVRKSRGMTFVTVRGQSFGRMPANPFMRKAFEGKKMAVRKTFIEAIRREVRKATL
jgi:HK97 gp10 family phage protein